MTVWDIQDNAFLDNTFQSQVCTHLPHISQSQESQGEILYTWTAEHIWYSDFRRLTMCFCFRELTFITLTFCRKNYNLESHPGNLLCINKAKNFLFLGSLKLFLFPAVRNHPVVFFLSLCHKENADLREAVSFAFGGRSIVFGVRDQNRVLILSHSDCEVLSQSLTISDLQNLIYKEGVTLTSPTQDCWMIKYIPIYHGVIFTVNYIP